MDESSSGTEPTRRKSARIYSRSHETELPGQSSHQEIFSLGDDLISGPPISKATLRSRRFYEKLKSDPEKYQAHKEKQAEKARMRRKALTQEEKTMQNAKTNARVKKCRAKKKELGIPLNKPLPLSSNTKAKIEERRIQERLRKRIYRASLNSWQKAWVNKKRRIQYEKKKKESHIKIECQSSTDQQPSTPRPSSSQPPSTHQNSPSQSPTTSQPSSSKNGFKTSSAKYKAARKAKYALPSSPMKYAQCMLSNLTFEFSGS